MDTTHAVDSFGLAEGKSLEEATAKRAKSFRRRKKIIKPKQQFKIAFFVVVFLLVYSLVFGLAIFSPLALELKASAATGDKARVAYVILGLHETIWPALGLVLVLSFIGTILFSHRIAGPIYRLERAVEDFVQGNFKPIRLRKTDEFKEIEDSVNTLAVYLQNVQYIDSKFHNHLKENLSQLSRMLEESYQYDRKQARQMVDELILELDSKPNAFTLE